MAQIYKIDEHFDRCMLAGSSCAFGVFDGLHKGHQYLLGTACKTAQETGGMSIALTFDIDPDELFHAQRLQKLLSNEDRLAMLASSGVDAVCVLSFTREFAALSPEAFLQASFADNMPAYLHVGQDFRFGAKAAGTVVDLEAWAQGTPTHIWAHHLVSADGTPITSTRIRLLLAEGKVGQAAELLGRPYTISGFVQLGRGEGADLGFATANLEIEPFRRVLAEGVYAGRVQLDGKLYRVAISVGVSPQFETASTANVEVHLLDFEGDLYGKRIDVQFLDRIRPMMKFASIEDLVAEVLDNIEWVRKNVSLAE